MRRLSLRVRLIIAVIALAAIGLAAADAVTYHELSSFEISRIDASLDAAHGAAVGQPHPGGPPDFNGANGDNPPPRAGPGGLARTPLLGGIRRLSEAARGFYVELLNASGKVIGGPTYVPELTSSATPPKPKLPTTLTVPSTVNGTHRVTYFTTSAVTGGARYRVRASFEPGATSHILILAAPLNAIDSTLHRLLVVEALATAAVLLGIALLGLWVVRLGLRPLEAMGRTASAIAAGNLSKRVDQTDGRTEVGRLGIALNSMLSHIESAVTARDSSLHALEASESKLRRFVADASHELRTPLAAVRAYAELFTRGASSRPADLERSMKGITRESERMSLLVEDLLLLAHLDEGRPLQHDIVPFEEVVAESVETARTLEPERPIEISLEPTVVAGDRDRLRQVVDNLLSNVRAHTPPDALLTVTLAHEPVEGSDGPAVLTVTDSGPGLTEEQRSHIFERFYRADPSRARSSGGAGLGLAIVSAVVSAHSGTVDVESTPGAGTTFRVRLPYVPG